jgi:hypothetical protein
VSCQSVPRINAVRVFHVPTIKMDRESSLEVPLTWYNDRVSF